MAVIGQSQADRISRWEVLLDNLKPEIEQVPHLANDVAELERMLGEAKALFSLQENLRAQAQETRKLLAALTTQGDRLRSRLGANLQAKHGFTSDLLLKYGFKPRRPPRRKPRAQPPAQPPAPAPEAAPPATPAPQNPA